MGVPYNARCYSCQYYAANYFAHVRALEKFGQNCNCGERDDGTIPYEEVCDYYEYDPESEE